MNLYLIDPVISESGAIVDNANWRWLVYANTPEEAVQKLGPVDYVDIDNRVQFMVQEDNTVQCLKKTDWIYHPMLVEFDENGIVCLKNLIL